MNNKQQILIEENNKHIKLEKENNFIEAEAMKELKIILNDIYNMIEIDHHKANELLEKISKNTYSFRFRLEIKMLSNIIKEKEEYENLSEDNKKLFNMVMDIAKTEYKKKNYSLAYNYYSVGKNITDNNIFNYYMGKVLYKEHKNKEAFEYLETYRLNGGIKLNKCLIYLANIYYKRRNHKKMKKCQKQIIDINKNFKIPFKYNYRQVNNGYDKLKERMMEKLEFCEDDFEVNVVSEMPKYEDCSISQKLAILKDLISNKQIKTVEKLIKELNPTTEQEKKEIQQFQKNRKIYKNKKTI